MRKEKAQTQGAQMASAEAVPCAQHPGALLIQTGSPSGLRMAHAAALPAEWLKYVHANTIYFVHNEVQNGTSNNGSINVGTDPHTAEEIAKMAYEIAQLREQVQTLCGIIREYINK
ncbi:MAG: hypothetical protein IJ548_02580 [Paludibacteraceae bacterium]|nr:hypothetical protein [Paludibacteraceae bacterium]MBQ8705172.1 hypothetical protein [Paludibacteraceae bacterium]